MLQLTTNLKEGEVTHRQLRYAAGLLGGLALLAGATTTPALAAAQRASANVHPYLYVADTGGSAVAIYSADANGSSRPLLTLAGPATGLADPWAMAFDRNRNLYVQDFVGDAVTSVFAPGATGDAQPLRRLEGFDRDIPSLAVDAAGFLYTASVEEDVIDIYAPGAQGNDAPVRSIAPGGTPSFVALDGHGDLVTSVAGLDGHYSIKTFAPGAHGSNNPIRTLEGPRTGLDTGGGNSNMLPIAYS